MYRVGIPRSLAYFFYLPLWKTFITELGHEVIESPPTSKAILDRGVKEAVNDACIPIKLYHGHAAHLAGQCDYLFCPRLVSVRQHGDFGSETFCPKFLGLPDMVRLSLKDLPPIIDTRIDLKKPGAGSWEAAAEIGQTLGNSSTQVKRALRLAMTAQRDFRQLCRQGILVTDAMEMVINGKYMPHTGNKHQDMTIAVVGYPYAIYDPYINAGLIKILQREGVNIVTQDLLTDRELNRQDSKLPKTLFWYFSNRAVYGGLHFMAGGQVSGIIHVTAFACGPDSMVDRLLEIEAKRCEMPYLPIAVDEHTGEAGVRTRVEAFLDMLRYQRARR